jgi:hypothetical protein
VDWTKQENTVEQKRDFFNVYVEFKMNGADVSVSFDAVDGVDSRAKIGALIGSFKVDEPIADKPKRKRRVSGEGILGPIAGTVVEPAEMAQIPAEPSKVPEEFASVTTYSKQEVTEAIITFARTQGYDAALKLIRQFQKEDGSPADKAGDIAQNHYAAVMYEIKARS